MADGDAKCATEGCVAWRFDRYAALQEGWDTVDGTLYCPLHHPSAAYQARRAREREETQRRANAHAARLSLTGAEWRAWDEFQSDLVNFHRETGKPAHRELRMLPPREFAITYRLHGRIDIAETQKHLEAAEKVIAERRIERLKGNL